MKANGSLAVDTNAVIAYRGGNAHVCSLIDKADTIVVPVTVFGELIFGAFNSTRPGENIRAVETFVANITAHGLVQS